MNKIVIIAALVAVIPISLGFWFFTSFIYEETSGRTFDFPYTKVLMMAPEKTNHYAFAFETCAGKTDLSQPAILVSSDSENRAIKLAQDIPATKCYITSTLIKASDPNTISFTVAPVEKYFKPQSALEQKSQKLKDQLVQKNQELSKLLQSPESPDFDKKFTKLVQDIKQLRMEIGRVNSTMK